MACVTSSTSIAPLPHLFFLPVNPTATASLSQQSDDEGGDQSGEDNSSVSYAPSGSEDEVPFAPPLLLNAPPVL